MTLNAVQHYVKGLLDGLTLPFAQEGSLTAYVAPPSVGDQINPLCFIWGSVGDKSRRAGSRAKPGLPSTGGFKKAIWQTDLWLYYVEDADDPDADSLFPAVIDAICGVLENTLMPVAVTDPTTRAVSTVLQIGETVKIDYAPVRSLEGQRLVQYEARLIVDIEESYQA